MKPRVLDLFSGIGGFALAFEAAGFETVAVAEIEPYPCKILAQHWPTVPNLGDVRGINGEDYRGTVDVVCGGFPCQDISTAGKGAGIHGERSGLWFEMLRIIRGSRPRFCLLENVPALRTRGADDILEGLESAGYAGRLFVVGAVNAGANHRRQRAWIVAYATGEQHESKPHAERGQAFPELLANTTGCGIRCGREGSDAEPAHRRQDVADAEPLGWVGRARPLRAGRGFESQDGGSPGHTNREGLEIRESWEPGECQTFVRASWWESEPGMGRVAAGVPNRAHRIKALGNSIVPAVAYPFALWIHQQLTEKKFVNSEDSNSRNTESFPDSINFQT